LRQTEADTTERIPAVGDSAVLASDLFAGVDASDAGAGGVEACVVSSAMIDPLLSFGRSA
jgi:hypothetical protein